MKRIICIMLVIGSLMMSLTSCKSTCKYPGCNDEAVQGGYCYTHYLIHEGEKAAGALSKYLK